MEALCKQHPDSVKNSSSYNETYDALAKASKAYEKALEHAEQYQRLSHHALLAAKEAARTGDAYLAKPDVEHLEAY